MTKLGDAGVDFNDALEAVRNEAEENFDLFDVYTFIESFAS